MTEQLTANQQHLLNRIPGACVAAVGKPFTVRIDKQNTVKGVITNVEFGRWGYTGRSVYVVFKVTMECGTAKASKTFFVREIPR